VSLTVDIADHIARIRWDSPAPRQAFTRDLWRDLGDAVQSVSDHPDVRMVWLFSDSSVAFSAGADIREFPTYRFNAEDARAYHTLTENTVRRLMNCPKPTLAILRGYVIGGGVEIATACDLRVADETARFAVTPAKLGIAYGPLPSALLAQLVGPAHAKDLLFSGRLIDATEAQQMGLVNWIVNHEQLWDWVLDYSRRIVDNDPAAIALMKTMLHDWGRRWTVAEEEAWERRTSQLADDDNYRRRVQQFLHGED